MQCEQARQWLHDLADRHSVTALPPQLREHLRRCALCRHLQGALEAFETLFAHDAPPADPAAHASRDFLLTPAASDAPTAPPSGAGVTVRLPAESGRFGAAPTDDLAVSPDFVERVWLKLRRDPEASRPDLAPVRVPAPAASRRQAEGDVSPPAAARPLAAWVSAVAILLAALALFPRPNTGDRPEATLSRKAPAVRHVGTPPRPRDPAGPDRSILELAPRAPLVAASLSADAGLRIAESTQRVPDELGRRLAQTVLTLPQLLEELPFSGDAVRDRPESRPRAEQPADDAGTPSPLRRLLQLFDARG